MSIEQSLEPLNSTIDMSITQTDDITWQTPNEEVQESLNTNQSLNEARGTLTEIRISRVKHLTPRKKLLYNVVKKYKRRALVLNKRCLTAKQRILKAERFMQIYGKSMSRLNQSTQNFVQSQIRMQIQKPRSRRFTIEDKVFALSLYKQSGKAYRALAKTFALPSRKSFLDILKKIPFEAGINDHIFEHLKLAVKKLKKLDRYCSIVFDEIALSASLQYTDRHAKVIGFKDLGGPHRSSDFADKALVFMIRGSRKKFKQPIAFYLTNSTMDSTNLSILIKNIIKAVQSTGLTVVSTICDQAPTNIAAINLLYKETKEKFIKEGKENRTFGFEIENQEIIPLYHVPHLLKGLRNNLVSKNLHYVYENKKKTASWNDIVQFYELDKQQSTRGDRLAPKLTDNHIYPDKMKKMKVSCAAHVFSQRVGAIMKRLTSISSPSVLSDFNSPEDTGQLCLFIDNLFDSANGNTIKPSVGKDLRGAVTVNSPHWEFWKKALIVLESMEYETKTKKQVPSVTNWIKTIKGLQILCKRLLKDGFKCILLRNFNQDPIENFFGSIRSHGVRNIKPTCANFISSFKSIVINNLTSSHSIGSNCENDDCDGALDNLKEFLFNDNLTGIHPLEDAEDAIITLEIPIPNQQSYASINSNSRAYVTGWVMKKIKKITKNCNHCMTTMHSDAVLKEHMVIQARMYEDCNLQYPNEEAMSIFSYIIQMFNFNFHKFVFKSNLKKSLNESLVQT